MSQKNVKMHNLFSYGTLQMKNVQIDTFGRILDGKTDRLTGFKKDMVEIQDEDVVETSGERFHPIVRYSEKSEDYVEGTMFLITEQELNHADTYEVEDYKRINAVLESGEKAWVYIDAASNLVKGAA